MKLVEEAHSEPQAGHLSIEKMHIKIALRYYWPGMYHATGKIVRRCGPCQRCKLEQIMGPLPSSKSGYEMNVNDRDNYLHLVNGSMTRLNIQFIFQPTASDTETDGACYGRWQTVCWTIQY